jgi:hypothetical protein
MNIFPSILLLSLFTNQNTNYVMLPSSLSSFILVTLLRDFGLQVFFQDHLHMGPPDNYIGAISNFYFKNSQKYSQLPRRQINRGDTGGTFSTGDVGTGVSLSYENLRSFS